MPATLRDVASKAGCAISTASDVLNNKQRMFPISDATKRRVFSAAEELGYHPNLLAKSLRRQKSNTIGVIASARLREINDTFTGDVMSGIGDVLDGSDYNMLVYSGYEDIKQRIISAANSKTIDGLLYLIHTATYDLFHQEIVQELGKLSIPVMGMQYFERHDTDRSVGLRSSLSPQLAVEHLYDQGCRSVGLISQSHRGQIGFQEGEQGFEEICQRLKLDDQYVYTSELLEDEHPVSFAAGRTFAEIILKNDELLDAYYIASDIIAAGFCDTLRKHGVVVPRDVAVVGLGNALNESRGSTFFSSIDNRRCDISGLAAQRLLQLIDGKDDDRVDEFVCLEPRLVVRQSSQFKQE